MYQGWFKGEVLPVKAEQTSISIPTRSSNRRRNVLLYLSVLFLFLRSVGLFSAQGNVLDKEELCPQQDLLIPKSNISGALEVVYAQDAFLNRAVDWLSGAVKIPTEGYDVMGPIDKDVRWQTFGLLHKYFEKAFPKIYAELQVTKVNTYALIYHWQGSDASLKPILLAAHQDVVPVDLKTASKWTHPPYSGYFDGTKIWGRGSVDDKSGALGILSSVESLLEKGFKPRRSVVIAFGIDEESSGLEGAGRLAVYLEEKYGKDGFALLVDEGNGYALQDGAILATPAIGEKGYLDVRVQISSPGGHSSDPPQHTSIGYLTLALARLEAHPQSAHLRRSSPFYPQLLCAAQHLPEMNPAVKFLVRKSVKSDKALRALEKVLFASPEIGKGVRALLGTTQAIDLIEGGIKVNALPEVAAAVVNHRIETGSSVSELIEHLTNVLSPVAKEYNLSFNAFGKNVSTADHHCHSPPVGALTLTDAYNTALEPAPESPLDASAYKLLSGTIRATYKSSPSHQGNSTSVADIIVAPGLSTGNTDTKSYWNLTKNIYRYTHMNSKSAEAIHTVDESLVASEFVEVIRFFTFLILNADESTEI